MAGAEFVVCLKNWQISRNMARFYVQAVLPICVCSTIAFDLNVVRIQMCLLILAVVARWNSTFYNGIDSGAFGNRKRRLICFEASEKTHNLWIPTIHWLIRINVFPLFQPQQNGMQRSPWAILLMTAELLNYQLKKLCTNFDVFLQSSTI